MESTATKRLSGKVALVTGGSSGIGQGIAIRLAEEGAKVVITYRSNPEGAAETVHSIGAAGSKGFAIHVDLGEISSIEGMVRQAEEQLGRVDILVNNAGMEKNAPFWEVTERDYETVLSVNLKAVFFTTQAFVQRWIKAKQPGKVINISSVHEELPFPNFAAYCVSKGGVKMLMRNLAVELAPFGITVNNIAPGAIQTPINAALLEQPAKLNSLLANIPLRRLGQPEDVAGAAAFLASIDADYITGTTLVVDGGLLWNYHEQ